MALKRDKVLKDAEKLVQKGKFEQAIREYQKILKKYPEDTTIINRVGDLYGRAGELQKAVELYEEIAGHFTRDGFTTKAIAILKKIQRLDPQRLDIFERLAELYFEQGLVIEAKREYQILADWYVKHDQLDKAVEAHEKLVDLDPSNHVSALRLADLLLKQGQAKSALKVYEKLGKVLLDAGKLDQAERLYRHVLEQDPPEGGFLLPVCKVFLESGRQAVAREFLEFGAERSPENAELQTLLVRTQLAHGESQAALESARKILEADPDNAEVRSLVGGALLSAGETSDARDLLVPAVSELLERGDHVGAQAALENLLKEFPEDQEVLRLGVRAYRPSGESETLFTIEAALAESYFTSGEAEGAKRLYIKLLETDPENKQFRQRLAELDGVDVGEAEDQQTIDYDEEEIVIEIEDDVEIEIEEQYPEPIEKSASEPAPAPESFDFEERLAEALVFAKYGLTEKAISHLEDVVLFFPEELEPRKQLALLYAERGDREEAVAMATPIVEHHRSSKSLEGLSDLMTAIPELADASAETGEAVAQAGFTDEESDLIEVVDVDGEMAAEVVDDEEPPELEEFEVDYDSGVHVFDGATEIERKAEPAELEPEPEPAPELPTPPVVEEVADELVEISDSFAGPSTGDLEQIDFFIDQELFEDAARMLANLEEQHGDDPEVAERRRKLKEVGVLLEQVEAVEEGSEELFADEEEYIDLAKELEAELAAEEAMVEEATGRGKGEAILEEVFREFQKGVEEQLSEEDADTHFNLGIAYREMGLLPEAIREFQVASRDNDYFVESCSNIGVCYQEQGMWSEAAEWYQKALVAPDIPEEARMALRYDLAGAYQSAGDLEQAVSLFEEIAAWEPSYREVADRLADLSQQRQAN
jgi:pilus assembly protein FimV